MKSVDPSAIFDYVCAGDFNVCAFSSALGRDYSLYSQLYTTPYLDVLDLCRLQDPEVDAKFEQAATTMDDEERNAIYKDLIEQLELGAYYVPLYYDDYLWACDPAFEPHIDDGGLWIYYSTWE